MRGRPQSVPQFEASRGVSIDYFVMQQMLDGKTSRQIAALVGVHECTLRRHLRRVGYRIECSCRLIRLNPPRPEQGQAAR